MMLRAALALLLAGAHGAVAAAAAAKAPPGPASSLVQVVFGLLLVLGLMVGTVWLMKRMGMAKAGGTQIAKVVGGVSVGNRERVMVVEVGDQWIVVGVAPGRVTPLSTMPRQDVPDLPDLPPLARNFSDWLKQTMDKRNSTAGTLPGNTGINSSGSHGGNGSNGNS